MAKGHNRRVPLRGRRPGAAALRFAEDFSSVRVTLSILGDGTCPVPKHLQVRKSPGRVWKSPEKAGMALGISVTTSRIPGSVP
eukprot:gene17736-biopygen9415